MESRLCFRPDLPAARRRHGHNKCGVVALREIAHPSLPPAGRPALLPFTWLDWLHHEKCWDLRRFASCLKRSSLPPVKPHSLRLAVYLSAWLSHLLRAAPLRRRCSVRGQSARAKSASRLVIPSVLQAEATQGIWRFKLLVVIQAHGAYL